MSLLPRALASGAPRRRQGRRSNVPTWSKLSAWSRLPDTPLVDGSVPGSTTVHTVPPGGQRVTDMDKRTKKLQPKVDPQIRYDLVDRVRREIAAGTYKTPAKWQAALERLLQKLEEE